MTSPYEAVREQFAFPFSLRPYQSDEFEDLATHDRPGYYWEPGTGKTAVSTHHALWLSLQADINHWIVLMPPILLLQWERWLKSISDKTTGVPLDVVRYQGTPKQRRNIPLDQDFLLMSYGLFKNDFDTLFSFFEHKRVGIIADEAHAIKNIKSDNHKAVKLFAEGRPLILLTGTPLTKPGDAYAYIRLVAPGVYRNQRHFEKLHVAGYDDYGNAREWVNLELLAENMKINTSRLFRRQVRKDLPADPPPQIIPYELDPAHMRLYKRIADERLVELENGKEINAISAGALRAALQQVVCNWGEYDDDPDKVSAVWDLIKNELDSLGEKKLVVVTWFRPTSRSITKHLAAYNAVAIYGETTDAQRQRNIQRFIEDPTCRVLGIQPGSGGFGVDGLQHVCSDMLIIECPTAPKDYEQVVKRLDRDGQTEPVNVRIAVAQGTLQVGLFRDLLSNDALVSSVQGSFKTLKEQLYGG